MTLNARFIWVCGAVDARLNSENGITWRNSLDEVITGSQFSASVLGLQVFGLPCK
jgi:hypothetical protein